MSDTFNDGDPIDATLLQKLKTDVARATALAGAKVSAGSNINVDGLRNQTPAEITPAIYFGGKTDPKTVTTAGGGTVFDIDYSGAGFTKKPNSIILTPVAKSNNESMYSASIISGSVTSTGAKAQIRAVSSSKSISLYFLAIQNQS
jgi:hypothetical protein